MNFPTLIIGNKIIGCFPTQRSSLNMFDVALGDTTQESIFPEWEKLPITSESSQEKSSQNKSHRKHVRKASFR